MSTSVGERITKTPGVCGGRACIAGHRVRVLDIAIWHELRGWSVDEMVAQATSLTLSDVHAALAYYYDHREEIQDEIREERSRSEEFRRGNVSVLEARLTQNGQASPAAR